MEPLENKIKKLPPRYVCITTFSLFSSGIILFGNKKHNTFLNIINDLISYSGYQLISLNTEQLSRTPSISIESSLDFDDAY